MAEDSNVVLRPDLMVHAHGDATVLEYLWGAKMLSVSGKVDAVS